MFNQWPSLQAQQCFSFAEWNHLVSHAQDIFLWVRSRFQSQERYTNVALKTLSLCTVCNTVWAFETINVGLVRVLTE